MTFGTCWWPKQTTMPSSICRLTKKTHHRKAVLVIGALSPSVRWSSSGDYTYWWASLWNRSWTITGSWTRFFTHLSSVRPCRGIGGCPLCNSCTSVITHRPTLKTSSAKSGPSWIYFSIVSATCTYLIKWCQWTRSWLCGVAVFNSVNSFHRRELDLASRFLPCVKRPATCSTSMFTSAKITPAATNSSLQNLGSLVQWQRLSCNHCSIRDTTCTSKTGTWALCWRSTFFNVAPWFVALFGRSSEGHSEDLRQLRTSEEGRVHLPECQWYAPCQAAWHEGSTLPVNHSPSPSSCNWQERSVRAPGEEAGCSARLQPLDGRRWSQQRNALVLHCRSKTNKWYKKIATHGGVGAPKCILVLHEERRAEASLQVFESGHQRHAWRWWWCWWPSVGKTSEALPFVGGSHWEEGETTEAPCPLFETGAAEGVPVSVPFLPWCTRLVCGSMLRSLPWRSLKKTSLLHAHTSYTGPYPLGT